MCRLFLNLTAFSGETLFYVIERLESREKSRQAVCQAPLRIHESTTFEADKCLRVYERGTVQSIKDCSDEEFSILHSRGFEAYFSRSNLQIAITAMRTE